MTTENGEAGQGQQQADAAEALTARLRRDMVGALEIFTVYLGERLGLYRALAADGPATSAELAGRTGTDERYVREWLEHHAASGLLEVDDPAAGPLVRRYRLPAAHAAVLADPDDVRYRAFNGVEIARAARQLPDLADAFRTGGAPAPLPWAPEGRADYNRAVYLNLLGTQWLPGIADVDRRLREEPGRPGGRPGLRPGVVEHRDRAGLPAGQRRRVRPGCRRDRGRPAQRRARRSVRPGDLRRHRRLRAGLVRPV